MPSLSVEQHQQRSSRNNNSKQHAMKKLWFALTFFLGGFAHELRNPVSCQCINSRTAVVWRLDGRKDAG